MIEKAIQVRFGDGKVFSDKVRKMYDEIDHLIGQKNQINNDIVATKNRVAILENEIFVLEDKITDLKAAIVKQTIVKSIAVLKNRLDAEMAGIAILEKKSEEIRGFSVREMRLYDIQQEVLNVLESKNTPENISSTILHNNIRGIISRVIVHSSAELSVYWLDNSITKINGGALYG